MDICVQIQARRLEYLKGPAIAFCLIPLRQSLIKPYTGLASSSTSAPSSPQC